MPQRIREMFADVDLQGTNLHSFLADICEEAMAYGLCGILVEHPPAEKQLSLAEERQRGLRPYFVKVNANSLLDYDSERVNGQETFTMLRFVETVSERDPDNEFVVKDIEQVRVLNPGRWRIYREKRNETSGVLEWQLHDEGTTSLNKITFVPAYGDKRGFMNGRPPLAELAWLNVEHWQSRSDQQTILHVARVPVLFGKKLGDGPISVGAASATARTAGDTVALRVSGAFSSEESLRAVTLRLNDRYIPLTDIASIVRRPAEPPAPLFRVNGQPAVGLAVSMAPTGNMLDFGQALRSRMNSEAAQLPHGIEMTRIADQSAVVKEAVSGFVHVLGEAVIIVLAVSFVSLGLRAGLVVAAAIPLVLAMTFVCMHLAGIGLQRISLGALIIALGLLVDDAMITVETMVARLEAGDSRASAATYAFTSTAFPMLTGTLVMIAGFIPVGFAASSAGEYCYTLFAVVLIALISSWVVAVLFSPLTGSWLLPAALQKHTAGPGLPGRLYQRMLACVLRHRLLTAGLALVALVLAGVGTTYMQGEFFPASDRPELLVSLSLPANASQEATLRQTERLERAVSASRDVDHYSSYVGTGAIRFYLPMDVLLDDENTAQLVVVARSLAARGRLQHYLDRVLARDFSDITTRVSPLELGPPVGWPVRYRVSGPDYRRVQALAERLSTLAGASPLTREVNQTAGEPERVITLKVNQTAARAAGLSSDQIARYLNTLWSGALVTTVRDRNRLIDVVLQGNADERRNLDSLSGLLLTSSSGAKIPLAQVATPQWGLEDPVIWRRQRLPFITVQMDLAPGLRAETVSAGLKPLINHMQAELPVGYTISEDGAVAESDKGNSSVFAILPVTLLCMLVLLMIQLKRVSRMLLALLMAPFGLPGIVLAMLPTGTPMGFVALLGIIALAGMIIRNAVILITEADNNREAGMPCNAAIEAAALHRARPVLLTASAAILGMIPISRQVFWGPMALAIIGGLLVATLVTLTVLPAAMSLIMQTEARLAASRAARASHQNASL
ncbi:efflux RND transporter permease subunit [Pantoea septica]|uniref:efflux RND transporter permease subunit n=1 Tax=Pantoea septica TaxID=472695 RepID=UPI002897C018|nr:efflux RND transporter permease subunit [Pantoea septica]